MSDAPYQKECSFCKNKITMSKESGNWLPYELNSDKKHDCRSKPTNQATLSATSTKQQQFNHNDVIPLEHVLAKLKPIGIDLDLNKFLKVVENKK